MTVSKKIELIMINSDFSISQFAKKIGYSRQYVYTLINGKDSRGCESKPQIDTLKQICDRAGYDFRTFLEETGYLSPTEQKEKAQPTIVAEPILNDNDINMLEKYNQLSDIQQTAIINLMDTFIQQLRTTIPKKA